MGILIFFLIVVLIATFGFWDTLAAVLGAAAVVALAVIVGVGILALGAYHLLNRRRGA